MDKPAPIPSYEHCTGQAPDGTNVCGYRDQCKRFAPAGYRLHFVSFWKHATDDCAKYESRKA